MPEQVQWTWKEGNYQSYYILIPRTIDLFQPSLWRARPGLGQGGLPSLVAGPRLQGKENILQNTFTKKNYSDQKRAKKRRWFGNLKSIRTLNWIFLNFISNFQNYTPFFRSILIILNARTLGWRSTSKWSRGRGRSQAGSTMCPSSERTPGPGWWVLLNASTTITKGVSWLTEFSTVSFRP